MVVVRFVPGLASQLSQAAACCSKASLVAVANANALQLPLPPKPGWLVSPVFWVLRQAVGHLRQPWDPRDRARQEPPVGARCPVTAVDGMVSGYDYDYDYVCMYVCIYVSMYVCTLHLCTMSRKTRGVRAIFRAIHAPGPPIQRFRQSRFSRNFLTTFD